MEHYVTRTDGWGRRSLRWWCGSRWRDATAILVQLSATNLPFKIQCYSLFLKIRLNTRFGFWHNPSLSSRAAHGEQRFNVQINFFALQINHSTLWNDWLVVISDQIKTIIKVHISFVCYWSDSWILCNEIINVELGSDVLTWNSSLRSRSEKDTELMQYGAVKILLLQQIQTEGDVKQVYRVLFLRTYRYEYLKFLHCCIIYALTVINYV